MIPSKTFNHYRWKKKTKIFQDKNKFKQHLSTNTALQKILEEKLKPWRLTTHKKIQKINNSIPAKTEQGKLTQIYKHTHTHTLTPPTSK